MSYLLDKKLKKKRVQRILVGIVLLFVVLYFRAGILGGFSVVAQQSARPFVFLGSKVGNYFYNFGAYFSAKKIISLENETLKLKLAESEARMSNYNSILDENLKMKEILDRKKIKNDLILANVLMKPNRSLYDTFLIDVGRGNGVLVGQKVFALGDIPVGYIGEVAPSTSKVVLYSSPGEKTDVIINGKDVTMSVSGRGGGNFEMILPRDFVIEQGAEIILPGIVPLTLAKVATIVSDPRDSYQKALLVSPVNLFELKFVEVEK